MDLIKLLQTEFAQEAETTRKFLALAPLDKADWAPHEKSMKLKALITHLADIPRWVKLGLETEEMDFAVPNEPDVIETKEDLLNVFDQNFNASIASLADSKVEDLTGRWLLRTGDQIHADMNKYEIIRHSFSQTIHHRAQLGVYLRLLNIPIPGSYGPSADDLNF